LGSASRTDVSAGTTVFAFVGIDHVFVGTGSDGGFGALGLACTATDAIIGNLVGHFENPFMKGLRIRARRIAQPAISVNRLFSLLH
jgi:hypothetical protein